VSRRSTHLADREKARKPLAEAKRRRARSDARRSESGGLPQKFCSMRCRQRAGAANRRARQGKPNGEAAWTTEDIAEPRAIAEPPSEPAVEPEPAAIVAEPDPKPETRSCAYCGASFKPTQPNQRFCSTGCKETSRATRKEARLRGSVEPVPRSEPTGRSTPRARASAPARTGSRRESCRGKDASKRARDKRPAARIADRGRCRGSPTSARADSLRRRAGVAAAVASSPSATSTSTL
jgi:hypothetical protein